MVTGRYRKERERGEMTDFHDETLSYGDWLTSDYLLDLPPVDLIPLLKEE